MLSYFKLITILFFSLFNTSCSYINQIYYEINPRKTHTKTNTPNTDNSGNTASNTNNNTQQNNNNNLSGTYFLYLTDLGTGNLKKCPINTSDGSLGNCSNTAIDPIMGTNVIPNPTNIYTYGSFAYVTIASDYIFICNLNTTNGEFESCQPQDGWMYATHDLVIYNGKIYISNRSNILTICDINNINGSGCSTTTLTNVTNAWNMYNIENKLYISDTINQTMHLCIINQSTGAISSCNRTSSANIFNGANGMISSNNTMFLSDSSANNDIIACQIDLSSGELSNTLTFSDRSATQLSNPTRMFKLGNWVYISNTMGNFLKKCSINTNTSKFESCTTLNIQGSSLPYGIYITPM